MVLHVASEKATSSDPITLFLDLAPEPRQAINEYFAENGLPIVPLAAGLNFGR